MALPIRNTKTTEIAGLDTFYNGGKGSGNWGHSGRPGEVGGSGSGKGGASQTVSDDKGGDGSKYGKYSRAKTYTHTGVMRHTADGRVVTDSDYEPEVYRDIAKAQGVAQTIGEESWTGAFDGIDGTAKDVGRAQATLALDLERVGEELLDAGNTKGGSLEQHLKNLDSVVKTAEDHFAEYEYGIAHGQSHDIENLAGGTPKQIKAILARDRALREAYRTMKRCAEKAHQLKPNYTDEAYYKDIDVTDVWKD